MTTGLDTLSIYEEMAQVSAEMLVAARDANWDLLSALETRNTQLVGRLKHDHGDEAALDNHDDALRARKVAMIKTILAHDRDIRELTEPWLHTLSGLIKNTSNERKLAQAYGAGMGG